MSDYGDVILSEGQDPFEDIQEAIRGLVARGKRPLTLGGDHSISYPVIKSLVASGKAQPPALPVCAGDVLVPRPDVRGRSRGRSGVVGRAGRRVACQECRRPPVAVESFVVPCVVVCQPPC